MGMFKIATEEFAKSLDWRPVFRQWVKPRLSRYALKSMRTALERNDDQLCTGAVTVPGCFQWADNSRPCLKACLLAYGEWCDHELDTVHEVHEAFVTLLTRIAAASGSKVTITPLLDFIDYAPWNYVRQETMAELDIALAETQEESECAAHQDREPPTSAT